MYNPLPYISIPFVYLWNIIRDSDSKKSRIALSIIGALLLYFGIWLLLKWHEVPTYNHVVKIARVYSKDTLAKDYISAIYEINLSNGGILKDDSVLESDSYHFDMNAYPPIRTKDTPKRITHAEKNAPFFRENPDFTEFLGEDLNKDLIDGCSKYRVALTDFDHGFYFLHLYNSDFSKIEENDVRFEYHTRSDNEVISVAMMGTNVRVLENTSFAQRLPFGLREDGMKFTRSRANLLMTNNEKGLTGMTMDQSFRGLGIWKKMLSFFRLRDLTKANYLFSFETSAIDSITYYIKFSEPVSFSEMNVEPLKKDVNTVVFKASDFHDNFALSSGVKFFVDFKESNNIQNIRVILLTALLALPLGLLLKNLWALIINTTPSKRKEK